MDYNDSDSDEGSLKETESLVSLIIFIIVIIIIFIIVIITIIIINQLLQTTAVQTKTFLPVKD